MADIGTKYQSIIYSYATQTAFQYITKALLNGSHTIRVAVVDALDNVSDYISDTISINTYLRPVQSFIHTLDNDNSITLGWNVSPDDADPTFDKYNIYSNSGSGEINFATPIIQLVASTIIYDTGILANGDWKWAIRVQKTDGKIEENYQNIIRQKIPAVPQQMGLPAAIDDDTDLTVIPLSGGCALLQLIFPYSDANTFNVYWNDIGADILNFDLVTPNETFTRQSSNIQEHTTGQITTEQSKEYWFLIRGENSNGEEDNENIISAILDGKNPFAGSGLTLTAIAGDEIGETV